MPTTSSITATPDSMINLLIELVNIPSRAGVDSPAPVLQVISDWLHGHGIIHEWLRDEAGLPMGIWGEIRGGQSGPVYLLDATADTAPFGDPQAWHYPPDRATIEDGWMYGRGTADSKAGISVFCHVLADLLPRAERIAGKLCFVFEAEEHTGSFAGIRRYMAIVNREPLMGAMVGYPGSDRLVIGARGFLRARLSIYGKGAHSGSSGTQGVNAIERARLLLEYLKAEPMPEPDMTFPLPPKITTTSIRGGGSFSLVPDRCELDLDMRLTPAFEEMAARKRLEVAVARLDIDEEAPSTTIEWLPGWPAYRLDPENSMVKALASAASKAFGHEIPLAVVGPSSIANFLASLAISATAGLGVTYRNIHAPNECVLLESLEPTFHTYRNALLNLFESGD
jgi:succinyl-diaminopimelate desuccinylase